jgi:hypothetical protein
MQKDSGSEKERERIVHKDLPNHMEGAKRKRKITSVKKSWHYVRHPSSGGNGRA